MTNADEYHDDPSCARPGLVSQPAMVSDFLFVAVRCFGNVVEEIAGGIHMIGNVVAAHANYNRARREMANMADAWSEESTS